MPTFLHLLLLAAVSTLAHAESQSAFEPKGNDAAEIADIMWVLFSGGVVIFVAVLALTGVAIFGSNSQRRALGRQRLIIGGGIIFPIITLSALLVYSFASDAVTMEGKTGSMARIEVTGELWWWRVRYLDGKGAILFDTANELRLPAGKSVEVLVTSADVIHSFWVPTLAGKIDMIPGHVNRLELHATAPGVFRGQCAEYCGAQHAKMALHVVALEPAQYDAWVARQAMPAVSSEDPFLQRGRQMFLEQRCGQCHTVRGLPATGKIGPDLTHVGGRHALAGGILPNDRSTIASWISGNQQIKPGNRMPSYMLPGEDLRALAAYLDSLK